MDESEWFTAFFMLLYLMYLERRVCRVILTILGLCLLTAQPQLVIWVSYRLE